MDYMDPNAQKPAVPGMPQGLDPKLQETYDKVMNFNASSNASGVTPPQPSAQPITPIGSDPASVTAAISSAPLDTPVVTPGAPTPMMPTTPIQPSMSSTPIESGSTPIGLASTPVQSGSTDPSMPPTPVNPPTSEPQVANGMFSTASMSSPSPEPTVAQSVSTTSESGSTSPVTPTDQPVVEASPTVVIGAETPVAQDATAAVSTDATAQPDAKLANLSADKAGKKGKSMMPIFLIIGALIFIGLYSIIWIRIFGIQVPFLAF